MRALLGPARLSAAGDGRCGAQLQSARAHECGLCLDLRHPAPVNVLNLHLCVRRSGVLGVEMKTLPVNVMMRVCALEEREREREVYN